MAVTKESQGRLNVFADEPRIEILTKESSVNKGSWLFTLAGVILVVGLIAVSYTHLTLPTNREV